MTVLRTGYESFGEHETNPSGEVARALDGATVAGHRVIGEVLPVAFENVGDRTRAPGRPRPGGRRHDGTRGRAEA